MWERGHIANSGSGREAISRPPQGTGARAARHPRQLFDQSGFAESGAADAVGAGVSSGDCAGRCALGADYLVVHPGSGQEAGIDAAMSSIAQGLKQATRGLKLGDLRILLENTAGQGSSIGSRFEELKAILDACRDLPLGVCIDTAHTFAAGWDIRDRGGIGDGAAATSIGPWGSIALP